MTSENLLLFEKKLCKLQPLCTLTKNKMLQTNGVLEYYPAIEHI